jgi:archaemetzincin
MKTIHILLSLLSMVLFSCNQSESNSNFKQPSIVNNLLQRTHSINKIDTIHILPFGNVKKSVVDDVFKGLTDFYHKEIVIEKSIPLDNKLLAASKTRFSADSILKRFKSSKNILVITEVDIVHPKDKIRKEFGIFGLGLKPGNVCVVSSFRLKRNASPTLFTERLQKVSIHEVGHNLGLHHCAKDPECMMSAANGTIKQVDHEKIMFCDNCRSIIGI